MCEDGCEETCVVRGCCATCCQRLRQIIAARRLPQARSHFLWPACSQRRGKIQIQQQNTMTNTKYSILLVSCNQRLRIASSCTFPARWNLSPPLPPSCLSGGRLHPSSHTIRLHTHTHTASHLLSRLCFAPIGYFPSWNPSLSFSSWLFLFLFFMLPIMCDSNHSRSILMIQKYEFFGRWQIDSVLHRFLALFHASCQRCRDTAQRALLSHCQVQVHELAKTHTHTCTMTSMDYDATWKISLYNVHNINHNLKHHFLQWKL